MKKMNVALAAILVLNLCFSISTLAQESTAKAPLQCAIPKLDQDKVPFPIKSANTKFDLAEGESYILNGKIMKYAGAYFFNLDFVSQPWFATQYRSQNPYFAIDPSDAAVASKYENGQMVMVAVVAKRVLFSTMNTEVARFNGSLGLRLVTALPLQN